LHQVVQLIGPSFVPSVGGRGLVVLASLRSDQHTLGLHILGEVLRGAGWGVHVAPGMPEAELLGVVESDRVEAVGLSLRSGDGFATLRAMVAALRQRTKNPDLGIMVGGSSELADLAPRIDVTFCSDPVAAVQWLERRHSMLPGRPAIGGA
jgi:methylmalonyl-CoA mutase cobalamin-binding subunit